MSAAGHMTERKLPHVGILFAQFAAYHVDRCQAVAARLAGRYDVIAVEVANRSQTYAWDVSGAVTGARKLTLFPGEDYEAIGPARRLWAQFRALRRCRMVLVGIGYNEPDVIALSWLLRLCGVRVVAFSESKVDDFPRRAGLELAKALILAPYSAAIVGAQRHIEYFRYLGFRKRPVLPGYDTVKLDRVRAMGGGVLAPDGVRYADRHFIFIGRFVAKKNLSGLVAGYAAYAQVAGPATRRLVLVGAGPHEAAIRAQVEQFGIGALVDFPGFLSAEAVARQLAGSLALVLVSKVEQWGLVVNEALAFGLPAIVSSAVGASDVLVRNLVNGFVIEPGSIQGLATALHAMASDEALWRCKVAASHARAELASAREGDGTKPGKT